MEHALTRPEFSLPVGRENLRRVLRYPVSLFRCNGPNLFNRTTEFLTWLLWIRKFSGIADDEMVMDFPTEMLPEIVGALKIVVGAPGSK